MTEEPLTSGVMEMVLDSDPASIQQVVEKTETFLEPRVADEDLAYRVVLLATEAVTNAIEHGNKFDADKHVYFRLDVGDRAIELAVEDEGTGFDPADTVDPLASENLLRKGGRGILFMESMADEVRFEKGGRKVRIVFHAR